MTLQEYRSKASVIGLDFENEAFRKGFDAALSLELAVKFHDWYIKMNKMGNETRIKIAQSIDSWTTENVYRYWIDHVLKIETRVGKQK